MAKKPLTHISLGITRNDTDLLKWFNMLRHSGQSKSRWVGALLLAYTLKETIPTGNSTIVDIGDLPPRAQTSSGNFLRETLPLWGTKDINGDYTVGSSISIRLSNKTIIKAATKIKRGDIPVSQVIRLMIRRGYIGSGIDTPPKVSDLEQFIRDNLSGISERTSEKHFSAPKRIVRTEEKNGNTPSLAEETKDELLTPVFDPLHDVEPAPLVGVTKEDESPPKNTPNPFLDLI